MRIGTGACTYEWVDNWARIPDTESGRRNGRTHGVAVSRSGRVLVFHQASPAVVTYGQDGHCLGGWGDRFPGAHGMALVEEDGQEYLWLTDQNTAEVVKTTLDGRTVLALERPGLEAYRQGKYSPTWVAVNQERHGGNGDVWVADGYGRNYVHRYDRQGNYLASIDGGEGKAGPFACPHGIWIDTRGPEPELYIADRSNRRVQVYDAEGRFKRAFGQELFTSPCGFATWGEFLLVPELRARLAVLDGDDRLVGYLGENEAVCDLAGWPNHPPEQLTPGRFNSPHGMAAGAAGDLYVVEWIVGGRITRLARC